MECIVTEGHVHLVGDEGDEVGAVELGLAGLEYVLIQTEHTTGCRMTRQLKLCVDNSAIMKEELT